MPRYGETYVDMMDWLTRHATDQRVRRYAWLRLTGMPAIQAWEQASRCRNSQ